VWRPPLPHGTDSTALSAEGRLGQVRKDICRMCGESAAGFEPLLMRRWTRTRRSAQTTVKRRASSDATLRHIRCVCGKPCSSRMGHPLMARLGRRDRRPKRVYACK
jgi:hypothetical protein